MWQLQTLNVLILQKKLNGTKGGVGGSSVPYVSLQYSSQTITKQHSFPSCKCFFVFNSTTHSLRPTWTRTTGLSPENEEVFLKH